ncbi:hypothetical protein ACFX13_015178 [Malus domestica]
MVWASIIRLRHDFSGYGCWLRMGKGEISPLSLPVLLGCHGWIAVGCRGNNEGCMFQKFGVFGELEVEIEAARDVGVEEDGVR